MQDGPLDALRRQTGRGAASMVYSFSVVLAGKFTHLSHYAGAARNSCMNIWTVYRDTCVYTPARKQTRRRQPLRILPAPRRFGAPQGAGSPRATWLSDPSSTTSSPASTARIAYHPVGPQVVSSRRRGTCIPCAHIQGRSYRPAAIFERGAMSRPWPVHSGVR